MTLNPISIATQGVYSNNRNVALASKGYIDVEEVVTQDLNFSHELTKINNEIIIIAICDELI
jgi:hypothetical protein